MKQEIIGGIVLFLIGLSLIIISPNALWTATEKWKTEGGVRPSRSYAVLIRILGTVFAAVGAGLFLFSLK